MDGGRARVVVWNAERKSANGPVGKLVRQRLAGLGPHVCVVTEAESALMPDSGHAITSVPMPEDWYRDAERKVVVWSREPWTERIELDWPSAHDARIACARTMTPLGPLWVCGVCIPWAHSRVRWSDAKRRPWQDHLEFLDLLGPFLRTLESEGAAIVAGDYNQRRPRKYQPRKAYDSLTATLADPWTVVTAGSVPGIDEQVIDHVAVNGQLVAESVLGFSNRDEDGRRLSDHSGVIVELCGAPTP